MKRVFAQNFDMKFFISHYNFQIIVYEKKLNVLIRFLIKDFIDLRPPYIITMTSSFIFINVSQYQIPQVR